MVAFADTSGLIKLYVPEAGSDWMAASIRPGGIAVSELAIAETGATLSRLARDGIITERAAREAWRLFRRELRTFIAVPLDRRSLLAAGRLTARSAVSLRSLDAIHLRAALDVVADARKLGMAAPLFVSADARLLVAAQSVGLVTDNPLNHP